MIQWRKPGTETKVCHAVIRPICKNSLSLCLEFIESGHKTQGVRSLETVVYYAIIFQFYLRPQSNAEKAMAPHSCTLAWRISWTEEPGGLQSMGLLRVRHDWATSLSLSCIGEGNGNPHQRSCLKNPRDWGTWWAAICGVAQSWTGLKRLSSSSRFIWISHNFGISILVTSAVQYKLKGFFPPPL